MKRRVDLEFRAPADYPEAIYYHHPMMDIDEPETPMVPVDRASSAVRYVIALIVDAGPNAFLTAVKLAIASDIILDPGSVPTMREIARMQGVTRAAVSKEIKEMQERVGLKCARANKLLSTSETYRETNVRRRKNTFSIPESRKRDEDNPNLPDLENATATELARR